MTISAGSTVPEFTLTRSDLEPFTRGDLDGQLSVLIFYPFTFSPVCTDQLQLYQAKLADIDAYDAKLYAISCDPIWSQKAFKEQLDVSMEQLSDFEPKGAASRAFDAYFEPGGFCQRSLVIVGPDLKVLWSYESPSIEDLPGAEVLLGGLEAATSAV